MTPKYKTALATAVVALTLSALPAAHAAKRLTAPDPDWTGGLVTCLVAQKIIEEELGYRTKRITMPSGPGVTSVAKS